MASTFSSLLLPLPKPLQPIHNSLSIPPKPAIARRSSTTRRDFLFWTTTTSLTAVTLQPANAKDIPLFGLRKKLEKAEKEAEELVKEGFETAEKGLETAEKGLENAEKRVVEAGQEIEVAAEGGNGLAQAAIVAGAEAVAVLVATSVVNGILGPEPKSS